VTRHRSSRPILRVAAALVAGAVAAPLAQQPSPARSVERVRAALEQPPPRLTFTVTDRLPDFTVHIQERHPLQEVFDTPAWATDPVGWQPPAIGFDLMSVVRYLAKSAADAKRGHDERLAREDVQRAIVDFCAAQPNFGAGIQICDTAPR
jgi:hypothetical protein